MTGSPTRRGLLPGGSRGFGSNGSGDSHRQQENPPPSLAAAAAALMHQQFQLQQQRLASSSPTPPHSHHHSLYHPPSSLYHHQQQQPQLPAHQPQIQLQDHDASAAAWAAVVAAAAAGIGGGGGPSPAAAGLAMSQLLSGAGSGGGAALGGLNMTNRTASLVGAKNRASPSLERDPQAPSPLGGGEGPPTSGKSKAARSSTAAAATTATASSNSLLLEYGKDNPPPSDRLFVPKGTRHADAWTHVRLISSVESAGRQKRSGRDAVGLWCTACERVVHHGWTSGETNPVKRHCNEKRHLAILAAKGASSVSATSIMTGVGRAQDGDGGAGQRGNDTAGISGWGEDFREECQEAPHSAIDGSRIGPKDVRSLDHSESLPAAAVSSSSPKGAPSPDAKLRNAIQGYSVALVRSLHFSKVAMIKYVATDLHNTTRTKTIPLRSSTNSSSSLTDPIVLPSNPNEAMDSAILTPDWSTMRIPPYSPDTAVVLGNLSYPDCPVDLCCRSLLQKAVEQCASARVSVLASVELTVGVRLAAGSGIPSESVLSPVDSLMAMLLGQLQQQEIGVDSILGATESLQLELSLHESAVSLVDDVVIIRENMLHLARQHGLALDFGPPHEVHFHLSLVDSETGQNLLLRNSHRHKFVSRHDISGHGRSFLEGVLNHLPGLLALTVPVEGSRPAYSAWDMEGSSCKSPLRVTFQGLDYQPCSWSANLYLALAGILTTGLNGMAKGLALRPPASALATTTMTTSGMGDDGSRNSSQSSPANGASGAASATAMPLSLVESFRALELDELLTSSLPPALLERYTAIHCDRKSNDGERNIVSV